LRLNLDYNGLKTGVSTEAMSISISVNGEPHSTSEGQTILDLLRTLQIDPERVAVELDRHIVKQPRWAETEVRAGAQVEIVQFVGGG
jgi:thiamine biosynthesis protein ThiS